jgi:hypothetical protein
MAIIEIKQTTPYLDGQRGQESVVLPMPSGDAARDLMRTIARLIENAPRGGSDEEVTNLSKTRIMLASGDRIMIRVWE